MKTLSRCLVAGFVLMGATPAWAVDFVKEIEPILAKTCYECHGPKKQKGDLRLDQKETITKAEGVLVAGKPDESEIYKRIILPKDHDDIMPPKGDPLSKEQQELIKKWISEGANFGEWKEAKGDGAAATAEGKSAPAGEPKIEKLPEVPAASEDALARLHEAGALAMPLANNTNLLNIDFRAEAAKTGDAQLALLKPVAQQVAWLGLAGTQVTDTGLEQIKGLKNLRRLHLEKTGITDAGLAHMAGLSELRYLNLYGTKVTDAGLAQLKGLKNLEKLYLWQTQATDAGVNGLKQALPNVQINKGVEALPAPAPAAAAAAPAPATAPDPNSPEGKFAALAKDFKADSCCAKAHKDGKVCEHPCCKEALAAGKVCQKCNPK